MKVVKIDGFKGIFAAVFMGVCLFAGFVIFPGMVAMHLWNKYLVNLFMFPVLNLLQGVLLWGIVAITTFILEKDEMPISFQETKGLSDNELDMIMKQARIQSQIRKANTMISKSDIFEKVKKSSIDKNLSHISTPVETKEQQSENKEEHLSNLK